MAKPFKMSRISNNSSQHQRKMIYDIVFQEAFYMLCTFSLIQLIFEILIHIVIHWLISCQSLSSFLYKKI